MMAASPILRILAGAAALALAGQPAATGAAEPPLQLQWHQLVPPGPPKPLKPFFAGRPTDPANPHGPGAPAQPEGRWMSTPAPSAGAPAPVVEALDGKRVSIGGYVVPLTFDSTKVKEFLLVPFVGACIHVPPPPANQIIYVKAAHSFEVQGTFDPVWVTGTLKVATTFTGLAETGYSLDAEKVEPRAGG